MACDEDGVPLVAPDEDNPKYWNVGIDGEFNHNQFIDDQESYQQALDKVLFKGFYVAEYPDNPEYTKAICDEHNALHIAWYSKITCSWHLSKGIKSLESLTPYNLELTENAKNII